MSSWPFLVPSNQNALSRVMPARGRFGLDLGLRPRLELEHAEAHRADELVVPSRNSCSVVKK